LIIWSLLAVELVEFQSMTKKHAQAVAALVALFLHLPH
jgi:hypothetical protein